MTTFTARLPFIVALVTVFSSPGLAAELAKAQAEISQAATTHLVRVPQLKAPAELTTDLSAEPWTKAARFGGLFKLARQDMAPDRTWVHLFHDGRDLYVGFRCEGGNAGSLKLEDREPDGPVWRDDSVQVFCADPSQPGKVLQVVVNARGVIYDGRGTDKAWQSNATAAVTTDAAGWTGVLRIPLASLGARPGAETELRANFARSTPGVDTQGTSTWTWVYNTVHDPSQLGRVILGGPDEPALRIASFDAPAMGVNRISLEGAARPQLEVQSYDRAGAMAGDEKAKASGTALSYTLADDRVRRCTLSFSQGQRELYRCWLTTASPEVTQRVRTWDAAARQAAEMQDRLSPADRDVIKAALATARPLIDEALAVIGDPKQHSAAAWKGIAERLERIDAALEGPCSLTRTRAVLPEASFGIGLANSMQKVLIDEPFEGRFAAKAELSMARNEHEGLQVVAIPVATELSKISVKATSPHPSMKVQVSLVGHVKVVEDTPYEVERRGWWPDPLISHQTSCNARPGEHIAFWINVASTDKTPAGRHKGTITVTAEGCRPVKLPLEVQVWDFALPKETHLPLAFTFHEPPVHQIHRGAKSSGDLIKAYLDMLLEHRVGPDQLYRHEPPAVDRLRYVIPRGMNAFNIIFAGSGGAKGKVLKALEEFWPIVQREGWAKLAYVYGFDEVHGDKFKEMIDLFGEVHRRFPGARTMTTAQDTSFGVETGLRESVDIWVPLTPSYDLEEARKLRAEGRDMWWYTCLVPVHPYANWFIEYPAIESRLLMGAMSHKYEAGGFLYYMITNWEPNKHPIESGPYTDWNPGSCKNRNGKTANGDGSLMCAGQQGPLSTVRLENIRDGLEDYEYLWLLNERCQAIAKRNPQDARLAAARAAAVVPPQIVRSVVDYTLDPEALYAWRERMAAALEQLR